MLLSQRPTTPSVSTLENLEQINQRKKYLEFQLLFVPDWDENSQLQLLTEIHLLKRAVEIMATQ